MYYVYYYSACKISTTTSCFIAATIFSPSPSPSMCPHFLSRSLLLLHLPWWFILLHHQLEHQFFYKPDHLICLLFFSFITSSTPHPVISLQYTICIVLFYLVKVEYKYGCTINKYLLYFVVVSFL